MLSRTLSTLVPELRTGYPAIAITGPRQSGKTTFARAVFDDLPYVNFESPLERASFADDPIGFLDRFPDGAVLDEVQHAPDLLSYLQVRIDEDRRTGRWVVTGSQQLDVARATSQSLAGRVALLELLPLSHSELAPSDRRPKTLAEAVLRGGYPALYAADRDLDPIRWLEDYLAAFVARDVRAVLDVRDRSAFDRFIRLAASRTGQTINSAELGRDTGIDGKTVKAWLSVLEACYVIRLVRPYFRNFGKRMMKQPKLHFVDSGVACRLLHLSDVNQLTSHPLWGSLVETWCFGEVAKSRRHRGLPLDLWTWRSRDGLEVDLVLELGTRLFPIEIKATRTPRPEAAAGLRRLRSYGEREKLVEVAGGIVVYDGTETRSVDRDRFVPWFAIDEAIVGAT